MEQKPFDIWVQKIWVLVPLEMKQKLLKRPLRLGTHLIARVDCAKNMLPACDLSEI